MEQRLVVMDGQGGGVGVFIIIAHYKIIEVQPRVEQLIGIFEFLNSFPGSQSRPALFLIFFFQL